MALRRVRIRIEGVVQGVYFRAYTREEARKLGLSGWVRNRPDGTVEGLFEGEQDQVERMVAWCRQGSPLSRVVRVVVSEEEPQGDAGGFVVRY